MSEDEKRITELEEELKKAQEDYVKECMEVMKDKAFDIDKPRYARKISKIAKKYGIVISNIKEEHDELRIKVNAAYEEKRKKQFVDPNN